MSSKASGSSKRKKKRAISKPSSSTAFIDEAKPAGDSVTSSKGLENEVSPCEQTTDQRIDEHTDVQVHSESIKDVISKEASKLLDTVADGDSVSSGKAASLSDTNPNSSKSTCTTAKDAHTSSGVQSSKTSKKSKGKTSPKAGVAKETKTDISFQGAYSEHTSTFEDELCWCIGQLELGMLRKDATKPQKQLNEKHIRTLQSTKTPLPKKRQLMRSLFGDYRAKMKSQPLPDSLHTERKITQVEKKVIDVTGTFYKHSLHVSNCDKPDKQPSEESNDPNIGRFCFAFEINPDMMS